MAGELTHNSFSSPDGFQSLVKSIAQSYRDEFGGEPDFREVFRKLRLTIEVDDIKNYDKDGNLVQIVPGKAIVPDHARDLMINMIFNRKTFFSGDRDIMWPSITDPLFVDAKPEDGVKAEDRPWDNIEFQPNSMEIDFLGGTHTISFQEFPEPNVYRIYGTSDNNNFNSNFDDVYGHTLYIADRSLSHQPGDNASDYFGLYIVYDEPLQRFGSFFASMPKFEWGLTFTLEQVGAPRTFEEGLAAIVRGWWLQRNLWALGFGGNAYGENFLKQSNLVTSDDFVGFDVLDTHEAHENWDDHPVANSATFPYTVIKEPEGDGKTIVDMVMTNTPGIYTDIQGWVYRWFNNFTSPHLKTPVLMFFENFGTPIEEDIDEFTLRYNLELEILPQDNE